VVAVLGVPERQALMHLVAVTSPVAALAQVARLFEVVDDLSSSTLGNTDRLRDVPQADRGLGGDDLEHVGVVRYEPERMILVCGT
jgi:hypothetical protein